MHLTRVALRQAPGLRRPLVFEDLPAGLVVFSGPNASGKSTLGRVIGGALWPERAPKGVDAQTVWALAGGRRARAVTVHGRTSWEGQAPSVPQALGAVWSLTLRDLIQADGRSEEAVARELERQLAGGFDLDALQVTERRRVRPSRGLSQERDAAREQLRTLLDDSEALAREEQELAVLRRERDGAAQAPRRLEEVRRALRRLELVAEREQVQRAMDAFPSPLSGLPDNLQETVEALWADVDGARREEADRHAAFKKAEAEVAAARIQGEPPSRSLVDAWKREAEELVALAQEQVRAERRLEEARAAWAERRARVLAREGQAPSVDAVERLRRAVTERETARVAFSAHGQHPPPRCEPASEAARSERERVARSLEAWLALPDQAARSSDAARLPDPWRQVLIVVGVGGALLGVLLAAWGAAWGAWVVGIVGGGAWGAWLLDRWAQLSRPDVAEAAVSLRRKELESSVAGGPGVPSSWTRPEVGRALEEAWRWIRQDDQARDGRERRERWDREATRLEQVQQAAEDEVRQQVAESGLSAAWVDLTLLEQADRLRALADARAIKVEAEARVTQGAARLREAQERLQGALSEVGVEGLPALDAPSGIRAAVEAVSRALDRWEQARTTQATAARELGRAREAVERSQNRRADTLRRWGVPDADRAELDGWARQLPAWREHRDRLAQIDRDLLALAVPESLPEDAEALTSMGASLEAQAASLEQVSAQIAKIESRVAQATEGRSVQDALVRLTRAEDGLAAERDEVLSAVIGEALVQELRDAQQERDVPELLRRARSWLLRFTRNRYRLDVGAQGELSAFDLEAGLSQRLTELSDGTRVQLLLAARIAYIEHVEAGGEPAPLFLDEVLSTTDEARFRAIAEALYELVREGRQVLYATSDPVEAHRWEAHAPEGVPVRVVSTATEGVDPGWDDVGEAEIGLAPSVPDPGGHTAVSYAAALGCARPGLHDPVDRWPVALFLEGNLEEAATLAREGVQTVGQLRGLLAEALPVPVSSGLCAQVMARAGVAEEVRRAMGVGRGRPVLWEEVVASEAISATFEERVRAVHEQHHDDAHALVAAVGDLPRFRAEALDRLAQHLEEIGCLDPRPALPFDEVMGRAMTSAREPLERGVLTLGEVDRQARWVRDLLESEG